MEWIEIVREMCPVNAKITVTSVEIEDDDVVRISITYKLPRDPNKVPISLKLTYIE